MMRAQWFKLFSGAALSLCLSSGTSACTEPATSQRPLGRGLNVLGSESFWAGQRPTLHAPGDFKKIRAAGFDHVRINVYAFSSMDRNLVLSDSFLARLESTLSEALSAGLVAIIDLHDFRACAKNAESCEERVLAFWRQVAPIYAKHSESVVFEILNEPHGEVSPRVWNRILDRSLSEIRKTNPDREIIIGPAESNQPKALSSLELPDQDRSITVTVHYYSPFSFTHQGASWTTRSHPLGRQWTSPSGLRAIDRDFANVARWARRTSRPVYLGEFGAIKNSDASSRAAWAKAVVTSAEANGFSWSYWNFNGSDFGIYSPLEGRWQSSMKQALIRRNGCSDLPSSDRPSEM